MNNALTQYFFSLLHAIPSAMAPADRAAAEARLGAVAQFAVFAGTTGAPERSGITMETRQAVQWRMGEIFGEALLYFEWSEEFLYAILAWDATAAALRQTLQGVMGHCPAIRHISVGFFCKTPEEVANMHHLVIDMMDYGVLTNRPLFFAEELPAPHYDLSCRVAKGRLEDSYMQAVVEREFSVAYHALSQIVMQELDEDIRSVRRLKHRLLARVENALQIMGVAVDDPNENSPCRDLFHETVTQDTIQGMLPAIGRIYQELDNIAKGQPDAEAGKIEDILAFLDAHYADAALDTTMVADACNVSRSYVGRVVKERGGSNFITYVSALRIGAAKEHLKFTQHTIDEIYTKVGYTNRWTFLRAFKRFVGMTPSEYRRYTEGLSATS